MALGLAMKYGTLVRQCFQPLDLIIKYLFNHHGEILATS